MEHYFKGKTALVTGAGWGVGAATAMLKPMSAMHRHVRNW
jgi:NADP-dependent 3-hydroxy acid dehydrogenase YdfG